MKTSVTISIDTAALQHHTDGHLAVLWHVAQVNPAAYGDKQAGELVEALGFEIIRRFVRAAEPELCTHQAKDSFSVPSNKVGCVIITGPQGCGKARHAQALAQFYGMTHVADLEGDRLVSSYPDGTLLLTNQRLLGAVEFEDAMRAAGLTSLAAAA